MERIEEMGISKGKFLSKMQALASDPVRWKKWIKIAKKNKKF